MASLSGHSYLTFYHPTEEEEWCEVKVNWIHVSDPGDYYDPPYEETDIDEIRVLAINGKPVPKETELPDWVTTEEILEGIDMYKDGYDGDDN